MPGPRLLLVNPWIYDFAAYDLWAKPLGLLYLAALLRENGFSIDLIDCLDAGSANVGNGISLGRKFGTGKFPRLPVPKPPGLKNVPKTYSRYGISLEAFRKRLQEIERPEAILVTSLMTYWYPGAFEAIRLVKESFPGIPVILGGIYATLCADHAQAHSGADYVLPGPAEEKLFELLSELTGHVSEFVPNCRNLTDYPYPAFDLLRRPDYVCILTSRGCPFRCAYCASHKLYPFFVRRDPESVLEEILHWHGLLKVSDFTFYDDALLINKENHIWPLLENIVRSNLRLRFHTPNALHVKEIDANTADLLYRAGFKTIRLGFETANMLRHGEMDRKIEEEDLPKAVRFLRRAGFKAGDIGVYILAGLPQQEWQEVIFSMEYVQAAGGVPYLAEYSPIPSSPLWEKALQCARYPIAEDPIYQNNSLLPCAMNFSWEAIQHLKMLAKAARDTRSLSDL